MSRLRVSRLPVVAALAVAASACGGGSHVVAGEPTARITTTVAALPEATATTATTAPTSTPADRSASILPAVALTDVQAGGTVDLASLVPAERPLLLWFWAPH